MLGLFLSFFQAHHISGSLPCCDQLTEAFPPFQNPPTSYSENHCFQCDLKPRFIPHITEVTYQSTYEMIKTPQPARDQYIEVSLVFCWAAVPSGGTCLALQMTELRMTISNLRPSVWVREHSNWEMRWNKNQVILPCPRQGKQDFNSF